MMCLEPRYFRREDAGLFLTGGRTETYGLFGGGAQQQEEPASAGFAHDLGTVVCALEPLDHTDMCKGTRRDQGRAGAASE